MIFYDSFGIVIKIFVIEVDISSSDSCYKDGSNWLNAKFELVYHLIGLALILPVTTNIVERIFLAMMVES